MPIRHRRPPAPPSDRRHRPLVRNHRISSGDPSDSSNVNIFNELRHSMIIQIGPDNTLFRNWVVGTDRHQNFGDYRGIALRYFHGPQYVIGNEVSVGDGIYFAADATGDPADVVIHGNNVLGTVTWDPAFPQVLPESYYLGGKPEFFGSLRWPSIGGDQVYGESTIPALLRWQSGEFIPDPAEIFADGFESGGTSAW